MEELEPFLWIISEYLHDNRNLKLVCREWTKVINHAGDEIIQDILSSSKDTMQEILMDAVRSNNVSLVHSVMCTRYRPINWNWLSFGVRTSRMYNLISICINSKYRSIAYYLSHPGRKYEWVRGDKFSLFKTVSPSIMDIVLDNRINDIDVTMVNLSDREFITECASPEMCASLGIKPCDREIGVTNNVIKHHEFPFILPNRELSTLVLYDRIDIIDAMISNGSITLEDVVNATFISKCGISNLLFRYTIYKEQT